MTTSIKITPDGKITEVSEEEENEETNKRSYGYSVLHVPLHWRFKKYTLTMLFPDRFEQTDKLNSMATLIYRNLKAHSGTEGNYIYGTVFISNETINRTINFTKKDFKYILDKIFKEPEFVVELYYETKRS